MRCVGGFPQSGRLDYIRTCDELRFVPTFSKTCVLRYLRRLPHLPLQVFRPLFPRMRPRFLVGCLLFVLSSLRLSRVQWCRRVVMVHTRVDGTARGIVYGMMVNSSSVKEIQKHARGSNGQRLSLRTVERVMRDWRTPSGRLRVRRAEPKRRPLQPVKRGRPKVISPTLRSRLVQYVLNNRGHVHVTAKVARCRVPGCREFSLSSIREAWREAGLHYLPRRRKTYVSAMQKQIRMKFAKRVLRWPAAYIDRTIYYCTPSTYIFTWC